ncbi:unnamed protein product [Zymoseptoria tritici ST99CH_1A5]|uniref:Lysine-specific metallo-endopeptidase domain-containing protein n=3 Tax=Zymoseptoria tritici TaxID=1047171 RepID=A0A1X7RZK5_ZYMT9|nr:unnamed protein product [Zymoseptoria tritici ST99CH_3D7]SMR55205.1 unnamed protein product [Zymoseptoria tritici ST99CH_1E4]SMY26016.1 unnamed protein product [Zymoseptoria tritici ST99CH_1A5]
MVFNMRGLSCILPFAGLLAQAAPLVDRSLEVQNTTNLLTKRALPIFSGFGSDPNRRARAEAAFRDAVTLAADVLNAPRFEDTFNLYFDGAGDKDEILQVFRNVVGDNSDGTGSSVIGNIVIDNDDTGGGCGGNVVAFTENLNGRKAGAITLCEKAYAFPDLADKGCEDLSTTVGTLMSTLGGVVLHELMHYQEIGDPALGDHITDFGADGYGPLKVRSLRRSDVSKARINADSYRWYAQEVYWSNRCGKSYSGPRDNRDTGDSACGGSVCEIM